MKALYTQKLALAGFFAAMLLASNSRSDVLLSFDWEDDDPNMKLEDIAGWMNITGSSNDPIVVVDGDDPNNHYLTTGPENNEASRDAFLFSNPGFNSSTTLTFTADVYDPLLNDATMGPPPAHTFQRAVFGIFDFGGAASMPSSVGIEHNSGDPTTTEWTVAEEDFANRQVGSSLAQSTWYTLRSVWDLGAGTKSLEFKQRDSAGPFTTAFSSVPIGFADPNQGLLDLDAFGLRMQRGTRIDNILVEVDGATPLSDADFNSDGSVNATDLTIWQNGYGTAASPGPATIAYWDFDSDGTDLEGTGGSTGTGHHLTLIPHNASAAHQAITLVDSVPNPDSVADAANSGSLRTFNGAYTTGTDPNGTAPSVFAEYGDFRFNNDASFTFETWFQKFEGTDTQFIATNRGNNIAAAGNFQGWELKIQGGGDDLGVYVTGSTSSADDVELLVTDAITDGIDYHVAVVWDHLANGGDGLISLYLDGTLIGSVAGDPDWSFARGGHFSLGAREADGDLMWDEGIFNGWLDEARFSHAALSPSEFLNAAAGRENGDANGDGKVDGLDFLIWQREFNSTGSLVPNTSTVPEPSALGLVLSAAIVSLNVRRAGRLG